MSPSGELGRGARTLYAEGGVRTAPAARWHACRTARGPEDHQPAMPRNSPGATGREPPTRVGSGPRIAPFALLASLVAACSQSSSSQTTAPVDLGMTSSMAPYYSDEEITIYEAQIPVALPVKRPSASDIASLGPTPAGTPYPHAPWLTVDDESLEVHYTLTNIDGTDHTVWLLIDPWNEFVRWNPGISVVSDEATVPNFGYDLAFLVPAKSRVEGTLTTDDMREIAIKLASVENMLASPQALAAEGDGGTPYGDGGVAPDDPNSSSMADGTFDPTAVANNIFNPQNRSNGGDPLYTPWIPPVIAGLTGFDLGIRTYGSDTSVESATTDASDTTDGSTAGGGANVAVEITIDVQDLNGNRFVPADSTQPQLGRPPVTLSPSAARF